MSALVIHGDALDVLRTLPSESVQCCVTSPPYWGLRDYGAVGQVGLERTPEEYVARLVAVFAEVRRVLRADGVLWLNVGDSYAATTKGSSGKGEKQNTNAGTLIADRSWRIPEGLKPKDLVGIPWMLTFALRADGWWLRSDCVWSKPNPMPESVTDRPTKSHEYVFLLSKSTRYFYNADAIAEPALFPGRSRNDSDYEQAGKDFGVGTSASRRVATTCAGSSDTRNARTVWTIATEPCAEAHFAVMPTALVGRCILAGSREGDTVLDPFGGSGTTGLVADRLGRDSVLVELNPDYCVMARRRIDGDAPLLAEGAA